MNVVEIVIAFVAVVILFSGGRAQSFAHGFAEGIRRSRDEADKIGSEIGQSLGGSFGRSAADALTPDNQTGEISDAPELRDYLPRQRRETNHPKARKVVRWLGWLIVAWAVAALAMW
jgi:Sec-independent protein translocase protein TatA